MSMMKTFGLITEASELLRITFLDLPGLASPNPEKTHRTRKRLNVM